MASRRTETEIERTVRRQLFSRVVVQWLVFFGLFVILSISLEFLYGTPQRPSFDLVRQTFGRHGVLFAAVLALAPIAIRDLLKSSLRIIRPYLKEPELSQHAAETQSLLLEPGGIVSDSSLDRHVERLHQMVMSQPENRNEIPRRESDAESTEQKPVELVGA